MRFSSAEPTRATVLAIYALSYFCSFGNPIVMPLMPFMVEEFSLTPFQISLMVSIYALPGACILPVFGVLEDRLGRKPILLSGLVLCVISSVMCFMAPTYNWLLFWRGLQGLSVTPLEALTNTLIADNFQGQDRVRHLGRGVASMYLGVSTFPLISGAVLFLSGQWRCSFFIPICLAVLLFLVWVRRPMHYDASAAPSMQDYLGNVRKVLKSRTLLGLYLARVLMAMLLFGIIYAYLAVLVTDKIQASPHLVAPLFSTFSAAMAISCLTSSWLTRHFKLANIGLVAGLGACSAMIGFLLAPSAGWLIPFLIIIGTAQGTLTALVTVGVAACATPDTRATILSLYSTLFRVSQTLSPFITGWFFIQGGFTLMLSFAAVLALVLAVQCRMAFRRVTAGA